MCLLPRNVAKHGVVQGCAGCRHKGANISARNHNELCRDRIEEAVRADPRERERVERAYQQIQEGIVRAIATEAERQATYENKRREVDEEARASSKQSRMSGTLGTSSGVGVVAGPECALDGMRASKWRSWSPPTC